MTKEAGELNVWGIAFRDQCVLLATKWLVLPTDTLICQYVQAESELSTVTLFCRVSNPAKVTPEDALYSIE